MNAHDPSHLPPGLPVPQDDGACDHLGRPPFDMLPTDVRLPLTDGRLVDLASLCLPPFAAAVFFFYPRTGVPGQPPNRGLAGEDWDEIPGARGCTPQSCGFRDLHADFAARGVSVFGVSTSTVEHQREFKARQHIPYEFLSDSGLELVRELRLPTFEFPVESGGPSTLIKRLAIFAAEGRIVKVWYPVFPPNQNAATVLDYVRRWRDRKEHPGAGLNIRPIEPRDLTWVCEELKRNWGATQISSRGKWFDADRLPGFIAERGVARVGLVTHTPPERGEECEVVTLSSREQGRGAGDLLLRACENAAQAAGCRRMFLTTTNDNLHALGFYQRRGWRIAALHRGAMDKARSVKPQIPIVGHSGIPLRDEIELEKRPRGTPSSPGSA